MKDLDFFCTAVKSATTHTGADIWDSCLAVRCSDFTLSTSAAFGFMSITQTFSLLQEGHVSGVTTQRDALRLRSALGTVCTIPHSPPLYSVSYGSVRFGRVQRSSPTFCFLCRSSQLGAASKPSRFKQDKPGLQYPSPLQSPSHTSHLPARSATRLKTRHLPTKHYPFN